MNQEMQRVRRSKVQVHARSGIYSERVSTMCTQEFWHVACNPCIVYCSGVDETSVQHRRQIDYHIKCEQKKEQCQLWHAAVINSLKHHGHEMAILSTVLVLDPYSTASLYFTFRCPLNQKDIFKTGSCHVQGAVGSIPAWHTGFICLLVSG